MEMQMERMGLWTQGGKERLGQVERAALAHGPPCVKVWGAAVGRRSSARGPEMAQRLDGRGEAAEGGVYVCL